MAGLSFDLSSPESLRSFEELVELSLDVNDELRERLFARLMEKARGLGVHRLDYHRVMLRGLERRGGMGLPLTINDNGRPTLRCASCGLVTPEVNWACPGCSTPYLPDLRQEEERRLREREKAQAEETRLRNVQVTTPARSTCPVTGMEFVFVKGGVFMMGDTFGDGYDSEKPVHEVELDGFYMAKYPVTQGEWVKVMMDNPAKYPFPSERMVKMMRDDPSWFQKYPLTSERMVKVMRDNPGDRYPVEGVSWNDARKFIENLNASTGRKYRLPTEAEWEYAARSGGKKEKWAGTSDKSKLGEYVWYSGNSGSRTHPVGEMKPNGLGLHDMSGNVCEWCGDWYDKEYYSKSPCRNPRGPENGEYRVLRGGAWDFNGRLTRAAFRNRSLPADWYSNIGFRLVLPQD